MTTNRKEIPAEFKWDLSAIYEDTAAFEADFAAAGELIGGIGALAETMTASAEGLYGTLEALTAAKRKLEKLYTYAMLLSDTDKADNTYLAMQGRVMNLYADFEAASFFVQPALIRLSEKKLKAWTEEKPQLKEYARTIDGARRCKPHTLSDENEALLAKLSKAMGGHDGIYSVFTNADLKHGVIRNEADEKVRLTNANFVPLLMSQDRRVRKAAFTKFFESYEQYGNTVSSVIDGFCKETGVLAKVRNFDSDLEASTFADEVTPAIMNNLIDTVNSRLNVLFDYYALKKEMLGVSKLHLYDIYTPLIGECEKEYSFDEATKEVLKTVAIYGKEYHDTLEKGIREQKWIDVWPSDGKRSGAYSAGCYDTQPYILLNYSGKLDDVSTMAHECGHSMHSYFSRKYNTPQDSEYTIFVAEVASTVNELLLAHRLLRESSDRSEKLSILNQLMETYKGTLYRQTMFAEFERFMHETSENDIPLTKDLMNEKYYAIVKKYFGPGVVCDRQIAMEWMRIPHFYYNFYVYKYATCISAACTIVKKIEERGDEYVSKYIDFLKCGGHKSPLDSLLVAEVDMTSPEVVNSAIDDFAGVIRQFRELIDEK